MIAAGLALAAAVGHSEAKAPPEWVAQMGNRLTPFGAELEASADGAIPRWLGGLAEPPPCAGPPGSRLCDPYADDAPLVTLTAANLDGWRDRLSAGQRALFDKYPDTYRLRVFPTRRSFVNPPEIYEGALRNAAHAELSADTLMVSEAVAGTPFPLPANGAEAIWNHKLRWRGAGLAGVLAEIAVAASGDFTLTRVRREEKFPYTALQGQAPTAEHALLQLFLPPARGAGTVLLMREAVDRSEDAWRAWEFSPGDKKLRKAPNLGYDGAAPGAEGLRTVDQADVWSGPLDHYDFRLVGKKELVVPANAYALHAAPRYRDLVRPHHLNPDLLRYELRRVWVVEAVVKKGLTHLYRRRTFYLDEDGWQIRLVDAYDGDGELWRVQEGHSVVAYDRLAEVPACETVYDLASGRYLARALNNEEPETAVQQFEDGHFDVSRAHKLIAR